VKRGGSLSFLVRTISNVLVMEIGWTDVGSGGTGRGVVLAKKQFSPTVSFSASAREFSSDFSLITKGRHSNPSY
jgi:hypothetical protein